MSEGSASSLKTTTPDQHCVGCTQMAAPGGAIGCWLKLEVPYGIGAFCFYQCSSGGPHQRFEDIGGCSQRLYLDIS